MRIYFQLFDGYQLQATSQHPFSFEVPEAKQNGMNLKLLIKFYQL